MLPNNVPPSKRCHKHRPISIGLSVSPQDFIRNPSAGISIRNQSCRICVEILGAPPLRFPPTIVWYWIILRGIVMYWVVFYVIARYCVEILGAPPLRSISSAGGEITRCGFLHTLSIWEYTTNTLKSIVFRTHWFRWHCFSVLLRGSIWESE